MSVARSISIPARLAECLAADDALEGAVRSTIAEFTPWFETSGTPFFPEYTDHGVRHVTAVLRAVDGLISDEAWARVSPGDAAVLTLAVLVHDAAMHLTEDAFLHLLASDAVVSYPGFPDIPWAAQWDIFLTEAKRYDEGKLLRLFGSPEPIHPPSGDPHDWTRAQRLLIGEFIRRNHPRVAHEIALFGVPGPSESRLGFVGVPSDLAGLAGLVARSHGHSLRHCMPALEARFHKRSYKDVHAVFLMTVLRISDYIQVDAERAPRQALKVSRLRSPLSQGEWDAHGAITNISTAHDDPHALEIQALPDGLRVFLRIRDWLDGIQSEMDGSWAVLGEVYGRVEPLNELGLTLRRVRSNLDDVDTFSRTVGFVPVRASFTTADARLLHLLLGPLYGDRPEVGIRELLQNAVDAVRERKAIEGDTLDEDKKAAVEVVIRRKMDETWWCEVYDAGIGMTADVIREYYLRAGASFRASDAWRADYEDASGHSRVLRSGRFGVGALAAFLLGNKIEVVTRHRSASMHEALTFTAELEDDLIEIRRTTHPTIGTTIKIPLRSSVVQALLREANERVGQARNWDWYCLASPRVRRRLVSHLSPGFERNLQQQYRLPSAAAVLPSGWHRLSVEGYEDVHWTYESAPGLAVNGIVVSRTIPTRFGRKTDAPTKSNQRTLVGDATEHYEILVPSVSIFDPDGRLPLTLQRTGLRTGTLPFHDELVADVLREFAKHLVVQAPTRPFSLTGYNAPGRLRGAVFRHQDFQWSPFFTTPEGACFTDTWMVAETNPGSIMLLVSGRRFPHPETLHYPGMIALMSHRAGLDGDARLLTSVLGLVLGLERTRTTPFAGLLMQGARAFIRYDAESPAHRGQLRRVERNEVVRRELSPGFEEWSVGDCSSSKLNGGDLEALATLEPDKHGIAFAGAELLVSPSRGDISVRSHLSKLWESHFDQAIIPFDKEPRREFLTPFLSAAS